MSHLPLLGKHVGLAYKDDDFTLSEITIYSNTYNALVSCLAIPDAFFAKKKYDKALLEYREISSSFGGRTEGRQAVFRAGLTLINKTKKNKTILYEALDEFAKLHNTQSEPLEYLGKSLAYAALKEPQEELKCLELAARKFSRHPLFPMIEEHIIYRMHESALKDRATTYGLALIVLTQIKDAIKRNPDVAALVNSIRQNLPYLYFIKDTIIAIQLAFWLNKQTTLLELLSSNKDMAEQIIFALLELNHYDKVKQLNNPLTNIALLSHNTSISNGLEQFFLLSPTIPNSTQKYAMLFYLLDYALIKEDFVSLNYAINLAHLPLFESQSLDIIIIKKALLENDLTKAEEMFEKYPKELTQDTSNISFLYSCFNLLTTGKDSFITQNIALCFPNIASLGSIYLTDTKNPWLKHAFYFEKKELYKQLFIYYHCVKNQKRKKYFQHLIYQQNDE
jgi:serine/threonine-protein kinase